MLSIRLRQWQIESTNWKVWLELKKCVTEYCRPIETLALEMSHRLPLDTNESERESVVMRCAAVALWLLFSSSFPLTNKCLVHSS